MAFAKQQNTDNVSVKLLVPYEKLGYVVGEEGAILRWLMDNFGVITEVGTENIQGDHVFMIHGPKANVLQAARQTTSLLDTQASAAAPQAQPQPQSELPIPSSSSFCRFCSRSCSRFRSASFSRSSSSFGFIFTIGSHTENKLFLGRRAPAAL